MFKITARTDTRLEFATIDDASYARHLLVVMGLNAVDQDAYALQFADATATRIARSVILDYQGDLDALEHTYSVWLFTTAPAEAKYHVTLSGNAVQTMTPSLETLDDPATDTWKIKVRTGTRQVKGRGFNVNMSLTRLEAEYLLRELDGRADSAQFTDHEDAVFLRTAGVAAKKIRTQYPDLAKFELIKAY